MAPRPFRALCPAPARVVGALACALVAGCAGRPSFDGSRYEGKGIAFRIGPHPPTWSRLATDEGLLAFRDDTQNATVLVNGRCHQDGDDVPLGALTRHLFLQFTERAVREETLITFDGREALVTVIDAKLDGVRKTFEAIVLKKNSCVYDFVLVTEPAAFDRARPGFERFATGFHAEGT